MILRRAKILQNKGFVTLGVIACLFLFENKTVAQYMPTDWQSNEAGGQGDSITAWANNGGAAIFYNPAGLSLLHNRRSKSILDDARAPLPDEIEANAQMLTQMQYDPNQWSKDLLDSAFKNPGQPSYLSIQAFPYVLLGGKNTPAFLIGFPVRSENSAIFIDPASPNNATVNSINTASGALAIAYATKLGGFRWGISARPNYRVQYETQTYDYTGDLSTKTYANTVGNNGIKTTAIGLDAGFMMTLSDYWFPTIGASVRNIPTGCIDNYIDPITYKVEKMCGSIRKGGTELSPNESQIDPTEIRAGVAVTPRGRIGRTVINLRLSADVYPIPIKNGERYYGIPSVETANLIHAGGELFFGSALSKTKFAVRGGYMNQEASWGASMDLYLFELGYSSYVATSAVQDLTATIIKYSERRQLLYLGWQL